MRLGALGFAVALIAVPLAGEAQTSGKIHRIGFLGAASSTGYAPQLQALREGLRDFGYIEGKNLMIEYRWAEDRYDRLPSLAAELVSLHVDAIVTHGAPASLALKNATTTIPVVMAISGDPVGSGIVSSYRRPGGNITGQAWHFPDMMAKRLEILREAIPNLRRVAILRNPANRQSPSQLLPIEAAARSLTLDLHAVDFRGPTDVEAAFAEMAKRRCEGFLMWDDGVLFNHRRALAGMALNKRLAGIGFGEFVEAGGLLGYTPNYPAMWRKSAALIDKILRGAKPADLPIEQADRLELVINLRTARTLGVTIPPSLLLRADRVME